MSALQSFRGAPPPPPSADEVKRYRAYLTRMSKWLAYEKQNDQGLIKDAILRNALVTRGERAEYLDDAWAKRVFGDKALFEDAKDGFWRPIASPEEGPGKPSPWEGLRPGDDVLGDTLAHAADAVGRMDVMNRIDLAELAASRFLDTDVWEPVHRTMLDAMGVAKKRGYEKPLNELQERSFIESLLDNDRSVQIVAYWLLNTRTLVDVMQRMTAATRGEKDTHAEYELAYWGSASVPLLASEIQHTPATTLANVRRVLLNRGILSGKKQ